MFFFAFVLSIVLTHLIGKHLGVQTDSSEIEELFQAQFGSVARTLFTLFELTTADDWQRIAMPLVQQNPFWRLFFVSFIVFVSWTMLSLLTAVASETMISATSGKKRDEALYSELQRQGFIAFIVRIFNAADEDGNGVLDKDEFMKLMNEDSMQQTLQMHSIQLDTRNLEKLWDLFDIDESGELTIDELVTGFSMLQEDLATKHVANIGYALKRFSASIDRDMESVETDLKCLSETATQSLEKIEEQRARELEKWQQIAETGYQARPSQQLTSHAMHARSNSNLMPSEEVKTLSRQSSRGSRGSKMTPSFRGGVIWLKGASRLTAGAQVVR